MVRSVAETKSGSSVPYMLLSHPMRKNVSGQTVNPRPKLVGADVNSKVAETNAGMAPEGRSGYPFIVCGMRICG